MKNYKEHMHTIKISVLIIFCSFSLFCNAQQMNSYINKTIISNVGYTCMETDVPDPCAGNEIYAVIKINKEDILVFEKTVSTRGEEEQFEIGRYKWKQLKNKIEINYEPNTNNLYAKILFLEFEGNKIIGKVKYLNGKIEDKIFTEVKK